MSSRAKLAVRRAKSRDLAGGPAARIGLPPQALVMGATGAVAKALPPIPTRSLDCVPQRVTPLGMTTSAADSWANLRLLARGGVGARRASHSGIAADANEAGRDDGEGAFELGAVFPNGSPDNGGSRGLGEAGQAKEDEDHRRASAVG